jgi:hypothetical protein
MSNLIIIGNGFDLAHGLETSYGYFIKYVIEGKIKDISKFNNLITGDLTKNTYERVISKIRDLDVSHLKRLSINLLFKNLLINQALLDWCDIEEEYFKHLNNIGKPKSYKTAKDLNNDFDVIKEYLLEYLVSQEKKYTRLQAYSELFKKLNKKDTLILNFNYTRLLKKYISNDYLGRVINIHGELENDENPIIFGYAADTSETRNFLDKGKEFIRNIKKYCYKRTGEEKKFKEYLDLTKNIEVSILGHSCGISDKLILFDIFNGKNVSEIRIFHHKNYDNYLDVQAHITSIIKDDEKIFDKLINYDKRMSMPQKEDKSFTQFIEYIESMIEKQNNRSKWVVK